MSVPARLTADFQDGVLGVRDVDVGATVHAIIDDVLDSVRLALDSADGISPEAANEVAATVSDYVVNHYGGI